MNLDAFSLAMRMWGIENNRFDDAFARRAGLTLTDLHALEELQFAGGLTPGQLVERLQLSSGAVTALVDRLERQGLLVRKPHPTDRRSFILCLTEEAESFGMEAYGPFGAELTELTERLSPQTREEMTAFFDSAAAIAARHAERQARLRRAATHEPD